MSKNKTISLIAVAIILVVFNVIAFVAPFTRGGTFWAGYAFSMAALLLTAGVGFYALGREGLKSKFYGAPLIYVAWSYLVAQIVLGFVFMAVAVIPAWVAVIVGVVLLGGCLVGLIAVDLGRNEVERIDEKIKVKTFDWKMLILDVEALAAKAPDVKPLLDAVKYSDPVTSPALTEYDERIRDGVAALELAVDAGDSGRIGELLVTLQRQIEDRNNRAKLLK